MRSIKTGISKASLLLSLLMFGAAGLTLTGCNTTEGAGKDIEALGDNIEDAASDAND